jgi:hypothetical protein
MTEKDSNLRPKNHHSGIWGTVAAWTALVATPTCGLVVANILPVKPTLPLLVGTVVIVILYVAQWCYRDNREHCRACPNSRRVKKTEMVSLPEGEFYRGCSRVCGDCHPKYQVEKLLKTSTSAHTPPKQLSRNAKKRNRRNRAAELTKKPSERKTATPTDSDGKLAAARMAEIKADTERLFQESEKLLPKSEPLSAREQSGRNGFGIPRMEQTINPKGFEVDKSAAQPSRFRGVGPGFPEPPAPILKPPELTFTPQTYVPDHQPPKIEPQPKQGSADPSAKPQPLPDNFITPPETDADSEPYLAEQLTRRTLLNLKNPAMSWRQELNTLHSKTRSEKNSAPLRTISDTEGIEPEAPKRVECDGCKCEHLPAALITADSERLCVECLVAKAKARQEAAQPPATSVPIGTNNLEAWTTCLACGRSTPKRKLYIESGRVIGCTQCMDDDFKKQMIERLKKKAQPGHAKPFLKDYRFPPKSANVRATHKPVDAEPERPRLPRTSHDLAVLSKHPGVIAVCAHCGKTITLEDRTIMGDSGNLQCADCLYGLDT